MTNFCPGETDALNRPEKILNMVLNGKFSQPYSQYPALAEPSIPCYLMFSKHLQRPRKMYGMSHLSNQRTFH